MNQSFRLNLIGTEKGGRYIEVLCRMGFEAEPFRSSSLGYCRGKSRNQNTGSARKGTAGTRE